MLPIRLSSKRARVDIDRDYPLKGEDVYIGAEKMSSATMLEEFGFVPSVQGPCTANLTIDWDDESGIIIHENEYTNFKGMMKLASPMKIPSRVALRDITNIIQETSRGEMENIDQQLERELENLISGRPISNQGDDDSPELDAQVANEQQLHCESINLPSAVPDDCEIRRARFPDDLYTPRLVRGHGLSREGLCHICNPGVWLKIKQSAYWYHMNFIHGISAITGRPYDPPKDVRTGRSEMIQGEMMDHLEGYCEQCERWVAVEKVPSIDRNPKVYDVVASSPSWWRHAQKCNNRHEKSSLCKKRRRRS